MLEQPARPGEPRDVSTFLARALALARALLAVLATSGLAVIAGCGEEPGSPPERAGRPPDVLLLVMDTVRPDLLSVYGHPRPTSPFLEQFAARGTRFERAYSTSSWTLPAHGSLFTGVLPKVHRANQTGLRVADSLPLLAETLALAGYATAGFSNNMWIDDRSGLNRGFEHFECYIDDYPAHLEALRADRRGEIDPVEGHATVRAVRAWLSRRDERRPYFVFVNVVEPHMPYLPPWNAAEPFLRSREERWQGIQTHFADLHGNALVREHYLGRRSLSAGEWETLRGMYEGELRVVDAVAREIVAAVDELGRPEETLVFVLSDHGENLGEHGHLTHVFNLFDTNLRIPLLARGPGFEPRATEERPVQIVDVHATILAAAGVEGDGSSSGVDLRSGAIPEDRILLATLESPEVSLNLFPERLRDSPAVARFRRELRAAIGPRYKLIADSEGNEVCYDLRDDPAEERALDPESLPAAELARLRGALSEIGEPAPTGSAADWGSPEAMRDLRAMGYAGEE